MAYRKPGTLLPIEADILSVIAAQGARGAHGFAVAKDLAADDRSKTLVSHGTLYKALDRLLRRGLLSAEWEDPAPAEAAGRPRRKVYWITAAGVAVLNEAAATARGLRTGEAPA
jgi:PadR family transcriptional regulator, regulatory protein PadR